MRFIEPEENPANDLAIDATFLEYKKEILSDIASTKRFLGNVGGKLEREKSVVRALLRSLGVSFSNSSIGTSEEPVDVTFEDARFQIKTSWDGYYPHRSCTDMERRIYSARS